MELTTTIKETKKYFTRGLLRNVFFLGEPIKILTLKLHIPKTNKIKAKKAKIDFELHSLQREGLEKRMGN